MIDRRYVQSDNCVFLLFLLDTSLSRALFAYFLLSPDCASGSWSFSFANEPLGCGPCFSSLDRSSLIFSVFVCFSCDVNIEKRPVCTRVFNQARSLSFNDFMLSSITGISQERCHKRTNRRTSIRSMQFNALKPIEGFVVDDLEQNFDRDRSAS